MKPLFLAFVLLAAVVPLRADDWLVNGDFSDGLRSWHGEARAAADADSSSNDNPLATPSANAAPPQKGLLLELRADWVKETQDFRVKGASAIVKVTYVIDSDTHFSQDQADYKAIPQKIGWNAWLPFDGHLDTFLVFVSDPSNPKGSSYQIVEPNMKSNQEQTVELPIENSHAGDDASIAVAFPPGHGHVIVHSITITSQ